MDHSNRLYMMRVDRAPRILHLDVSGDKALVKSLVWA